MLKQGLQQKLLQKLSPQQIQFIKLLQVPTAQLEARIEQELEENPALVELADLEAEVQAEKTETKTEESEDDDTKLTPEEDRFDEAADLNQDFGEDDYDYRTRLETDPNQEHYEAPIVQRDSLHDRLMEQVGMLELMERERLMAEFVVGNIDDDGYLRRDVMALADDLAFKFNMQVEPQELEEVLAQVQTLDPAGVGARDLQECLLLQLDRKPADPVVELARSILMDCFDEFTKKHFERILQKTGADEKSFREAYNLITRLNPKPGDAPADLGAQSIIPDFILEVTDDGGLNVKLHSRNAPELRVSEQYLTLIRALEENSRQSRSDRETLSFVRAKVESAKWFIDALQQRQFTLLKTMLSIANKQRSFFLAEGDEKALAPMILKDVADDIGMDISTVSRVANSKYVQTDFGIYPLKYFFSEGISTEDGEEVSNREVKRILEEHIGAENKKRPLSDQRLAEILQKAGYNIARRTVAKYREQLNIPVARLRKEL